MNRITQTSKSSLERFMVLWIILILVLAGCSQPPDPPSNSPGDVVRALTYGPAENEFLEALEDSLELTTYDGSQKLEDFDIFIFDGDVHLPAALENDVLVQEASRSGMLVLTLDAREAHKKVGLLGRSSVYSCGDSPVYATRIMQDANRRPVVQVFESSSALSQEGKPSSPPPPPSSLVQCHEQPAQALMTDNVDESARRAFASQLVNLVKRDGLRTFQATEAPPNVPSELLYVTYQFHNSQTWTADTKEGEAAGKQTASLDVVATFTVFLQNGNNPQGDYQYILVDIDASGNPTNGTGKFSAPRLNSSTNWTSGYEVWGWFQDYLGTSTVPKASSLQLIGTSPETANGSTDVTTGVSFSVNYSGGEPGANFTYSNSTTKTIRDWKVTNQSAGLRSFWDYRTSTPVDYDRAYTCSNSQPIYNKTCYLGQDPNDLSLSNMQLRTQAVYRTASLVDGVVGFDTNASHSMALLGCFRNDGAFCGATGFAQQHYNLEKVYQIDLGTVIPVPIASLTFSPNPSVSPDPEKGNSQVTGTVTLRSPAKMDTHILISSDSKNAIPATKGVTIKQGETSGSFDILTNVNDIPSGNRTVATINAFYAQGYKAQLTITN